MYSVTTYADDTGSIVSDVAIDTVFKKLEEDAINILTFMALNGIMANSKKTTLMIMGSHQNSDLITINVGKDKTGNQCKINRNHNG